MADPQKLEKRFGVMRGAQRIWAVSSIHGHADKLRDLHDKLGPKLQPGDRLIYLGNVIGYGPDVRGTFAGGPRARTAVATGQNQPALNPVPRALFLSFQVC